MLNRIFGHLITTLAGLATAALHLTVNGISLKQWLVAAAIAAVGAFAKDK